MRVEPGMAGGGLRGIMALLPWTPCRVRHHRPNGSSAITAPPSPARHPSSGVVRGETVLRMVPIRVLSREPTSLHGERRPHSRAQATACAAAGCTPRGLEPNRRGRAHRHAPGHLEFTAELHVRSGETTITRSRSEHRARAGIAGGRSVGAAIGNTGIFREFWDPRHCDRGRGILRGTMDNLAIGSLRR